MRNSLYLFIALPLVAIGISSTGAHAQSPSQVELRTMLLELKKEQSALNDKIDRVEALLNGQTPIVSNADENPPDVLSATQSTRTVGSDNNAALQRADDRLNVSGDLQVRYESNFSDKDAPDRNRGAVRGRLRANFKVNSIVSLGTEISTGDSDDPNSVHVTLSDFVDDFDVSLSRLYARLDFENGVSLVGGKFANPFTRSDLVWDGDVNPQGAAAIYEFSPGDKISLKASAIYSIIDEASSGPDSDMIGGQFKLAFAPHADWKYSVAIGYYDYSLDNLASADPGDFRANLRDPMGGYLSDFDLLDVLASASYLGFGTQWPASISFDYVKNYGAAVSADEGFSTQLSLGRTTQAGDWRFAYGYSQAEVDAVLGAFSHDNLGLATNYQSHVFGIDYALFDHVTLNATLYRYKPLDALYAGANDPDDWLNRLRLNMSVGF